MRDRLQAARARARMDQRLQHATDLAAKAWHLVDHVARSTSEHDARIAHLERLASVQATMSWIEQAEVATDQLVSVLTVTKNRSDVLEDALASLDAQHYRNWQMVLVDDGSSPPHAAALDELAERHDQIVKVDRTGLGVAAGRNAARDAASGAFVTYLDDDNLMHPLWLKAVVWGFGQRPDVDVFCGARLIDDIDRAQGRPARGTPVIQFEEIDARVLERRMQTDIGSIAHRSSVATRSDERYARSDDWDWLARATRLHPYGSLPCIAQTYRTGVPGRMSEGMPSLDDSG